MILKVWTRFKKKNKLKTYKISASKFCLSKPSRKIPSNTFWTRTITKTRTTRITTRMEPFQSWILSFKTNRQLMSSRITKNTKTSLPPNQVYLSNSVAIVNSTILQFINKICCKVWPIFTTLLSKRIFLPVLTPH